MLLLAAAASMVWVNADSDSYRDVWSQALTLGVGEHAITLDLRHWVSDGLMAVFFFVVGLEIKREVVDGELNSWKTASLPALAALGGMAVPALLFTTLNAGGEGSRGWAIPMATDIAFAVGVLAVLGRRVPTGAKVFLLTLAIVDDIGAILVIAIFYSEGLDGAWLVGGVILIGVVLAMRRLTAITPWVYALPGVALWVCAHEAGVHATIAGILLALLIPAVRGSDRGALERVEDALHPWSSFLVVPLFALANAGVVLDRGTLDAASTSSISGGIALGLVLGKPLGIVGATWLAIRSGRTRLPTGVRMSHVVGVGLVAGMGFTVSLFIANLSFRGLRLDTAKIAILGASLVAGVLGALVFLATHALRRPKETEPAS